MMSHERDESARTRPVQFDIVASMLRITIIDFESSAASSDR
jgi:hypothetical protein